MVLANCLLLLWVSCREVLPNEKLIFLHSWDAVGRRLLLEVYRYCKSGLPLPRISLMSLKEGWKTSENRGDWTVSFRRPDWSRRYIYFDSLSFTCMVSLCAKNTFLPNRQGHFKSFKCRFSPWNGGFLVFVHSARQREKLGCLSDFSQRKSFATNSSASQHIYKRQLSTWWRRYNCKCPSHAFT